MKTFWRATGICAETRCQVCRISHLGCFIVADMFMRVQEKILAIAATSIRTQVLTLAIMLIVLVSITATLTEPLLYGRQSNDIRTGIFLGKALAVTQQYEASDTSDARKDVLARVAGDGLSVQMVSLPPADNGDSKLQYVIRSEADIVAAAHRLNRFDPLGMIMGLNSAFSTEKDIVFAVSETSALSFRYKSPSGSRWTLAPFASGILKIVIPLGIMAYVSSMLIMKPLERIAAAAKRQTIRDETTTEPFAVEGPAEIRSLAESLNAMRERIQRMAIDRTQILRSVSHDLRTPLTRLRMRAERCEQVLLKERMLRDIDLLASMLNETLQFLNNKPEIAVKVDLSSLLETIVSDFADTGIVVHFEAPPRLVAICKPQGMTRAISNLIDNASRYATRIDLRLEEGGRDGARILVIDNGPGIPDTLKAHVLEPMFKADPARQSPLGKAAGFGLGLTIAKGIVEVGHNGRLTLRDTIPTGLTVDIEFASLADTPLTGGV
ncbi:sensor histidine kinase [Rhizobium sp. PP-CC-3G-465]|uniref:ATP-binding protein n=1 Tax=Rhizobium sp. PP-CC-3G-465 TaxID=2135648 RepID=UPI0010457AEE